MLQCEEHTSVTCWPAPDPEEKPPSWHRQGRQDQGGHQGRAGWQEGHQGRAGRAQGLQRATRRSEKAVRQGIQVRLLCWEIIVNYYFSFELHKDCQLQEEMCKSKSTIKPIPLPSITITLLLVKFYFRGLLSWILLWNTAFCMKWTFFVQISFLQKISWKLPFFGKRLHFRAKFKKVDPT